MKKKSYTLGTIAGVRLSARPSAVTGFLLLWLALTLVAFWPLAMSSLIAPIWGLTATALHFGSELVHQAGHALSARRTGYRMIGVRFWTILGASIYPRDEPELPAAVHIRRALGGAPASLLLSLVAGLLALLLRPAGGPLWYLALFLFLENLLVFTLGAFLPLGFTDGSTLLYWSRRR